MGWSGMVEIIWEFIVKDEFRGQFELAYGPGGAWSKLFARYPGFRGTTVLRDVKNPERYLTFDVWETESQRGHALDELQVEYSELEMEFEKWTVSKSEVGVFRMLSEAAVRPRGKARGRTSRR
ncbi:MAG: antibiotic biosynthesis monooxygenase [Anaerolineales bacterium]|jgi:hypothetical protein